MMIVNTRRCLCRLYASYNGWNNQSRYSSSDSSSWERRQKVVGLGAAVGVTVVGSAAWFWWKSKNNVGLQALSIEEGIGTFRNGLPEYSALEISKHSSLEDRVWISYKEGVYDITDFIPEHPGGDKILLGAGGSVEPFWMLYAVHKNSHVLSMLEQYRIGNLSSKDVGVATKDMDDPYEKEPRRHPALIATSKRPYNAETPPNLLADNFITPNALFYVRNHLPVPEIDVTTYELEIEGPGMNEKAFTLDDIKKFPKYTVTSTVMCAGNRRTEMSAYKKVKGLDWKHGAVGNATWGGARLCDVLRSLGLTEESLAKNPKLSHIQLEGLDVDPTSSPYGASIPIEKALDPRGDVLLAYEMNGEPIPKDHGFPVRAIVPGIVGARNVKWLGRIIVSEVESDSHWQQYDYKGFSPSVDWETVDYSKAPAIQELPVTSAVCSPVEGETIKLNEGKIPIKGYAWSGGGNKIIRVDVSVDGGKSWQVADLEQDDSKAGRCWSWSLFYAEIPVPQGLSQLEICAKAVDSSYNVQPESFPPIWNLRGVLGNAYHRVHVKINP